MKEHFFNGEMRRFDSYPIKIYLETKFSQDQYLKHEFNSMKIEFYSEDKNWSYANQTEVGSYDIRMYIEYDNTVQYDGYKLDVSHDKIILTVNEYRGIMYGVRHLEKLISNQTLPLGTITEVPSVEYRGIIEGFYGVPWSHQNRLDAFDVMYENNMNTYIYAPKDDPYHRELWKESYPEKEEIKLKELIDKAKQTHTHFVS